MIPKRLAIWVVVAALIGLGAVLAACGPAWRPPLYQKPGFHLQWVDRITLLPAVDTRIDRSISVELSEQVDDASVKILTDKGYPTALSRVNGDLGSMTVEDLADADAAWIQRLGPPESRWVLVLSLVDLATSIGYGSSGNADIAGFLYDKKSGTLVWRDRGMGRQALGGLAGMAMIGMMDDEAISDALEHLFASFPRRTPSDPYQPEPTASGAH